MGMVTVLKTQLGAGWHDPSGGGGGRQASDIYRAGEQQGGCKTWRIKVINLIPMKLYYI